MPEISTADLRRLEALQGRLDRSEETRKATTAEVKTLRAAAATAEREDRAARAARERADMQLDALLVENRRLAETIPALTREAETARASAIEARTIAERAERSLAGLTQEVAGLRRQANEAVAARDGAEKQLGMLRAQLAERKMPPVIPPEEAGRLVDDFVGGLTGGLARLRPVDGEIRLKVAFGKAGDKAGFVVPTAESAAQLGPSLSEVHVRFSRAESDA